jgi:type IV pilus assembly protein PilX
MIAGPRRQRGAALVIGLILLLVLTILAVSGVVTSTLELRMVGNQQQQERAFQAADTGIERALAGDVPLTTSITPTPVPLTEVERYTGSGTADASGDTFEGSLRYMGDAAATSVPGYSLGAGLLSYHFQVEITGTSSGGAVSQHVQGFYIVGPGGA